MSVLNSKVLVLNKSWTPINVQPLKRAISMVYQGDAEIVSVDHNYQTFSFDDWMDAATFAKDGAKYLQGSNWRLLVPEVIVLTGFNGFNRRQVRFSRKNLFDRDRYACQYCGKRCRSQDLTVDHVIPRSRGGTTVWENVVLACLKCNHKKDSKLPTEVGMNLRRKPRQPRWEDVKVKGIDGLIPSSWEAFLDEIYWNVELKS